MAPGDFKVIDITSTSVTFQWNAVNNPPANGVVQQYVITCTERNTNREVSRIKALHCYSVIIG